MTPDDAEGCVLGILTIEGGRPLYGTVTISGAKNGVLPLLAAAAAQSGSFRLENCPDLTDVSATADILRHLGCGVRRCGSAIEVDSRGLCCTQIPRTLMTRLRSSIIFLGALLARCGNARLWLPGGCLIGLRPIDIHLNALRQLGAQVEERNGEVICSASHMRGGEVSLSYPSVGATENLLLAGLRCPEGVTIRGAAREPEVAALARFLRKMGAEIRGEGTGCIRMNCRPLHGGVSFAVLPDRIETATYLCALGSCGGKLRLEHTSPACLMPVLSVLRAAGMELSLRPDAITAKCDELHAVDRIRTGPYPAFPTDAQAPVMAALLCAKGKTTVEETVFEHRFRHVDALRAMGADITVTDDRAVIRGVCRLHGADAAATDLRGGAAMVIAALGAEGISRISETQHIFRGYDSLCEKLSALGARIALRGETLEEHT